MPPKRPRHKVQIHYRQSSQHSTTVMVPWVCLPVSVPVCPPVCLPASHLSVLEGNTVNSQGLTAADTFTPSREASSESAVPVHLYSHLLYSCTVLPPSLYCHLYSRATSRQYSTPVVAPPGSTVQEYWHLQSVCCLQVYSVHPVASSREPAVS
jgi:hypothetical protein